MGSPYAHMSTPNGGAHTGPRRGPVTLRFLFSYRTVSLRLPGSLTTPKGWYRTPLGVRYTNPEGLVYATLHKPFGVCVPDPKGVRYHTPLGCDTLRLMRTRVYVYVCVQFWPFLMQIQSFCAGAFWPKLYDFLFFDRLPSGRLTLRVKFRHVTLRVPTPEGGW